MKKLLTIATIAVLPLSLTACQSGRADRTTASPAPAAGRFTSADQERTMVNEMNLNRVGDTCGKAASECDNMALRRTIAGQGQRSRTTQTTTGTTNEMGIGKGGLPVGQSSSTSADIGPYESDFRQDYQSNFSTSGYTYDQYRPAYRYGFDMGSDPRYASSGDWGDVEMQAHRNWDEGTLGPWDRYKNAVRYGWERGRLAAQGRG